MSNRMILKWTGIVTVLLVVSRLLGLVREVAIASRFSVSLEADAYMAAAVLPQILYMAFNDSIKTAFIPVYGEYHKSDKGRTLVVTSFVIMGVVLTGISVLLVYFAPILVHLLFIGFTGEKYAITVVMARILLPSLVFMGLAGLCSGVLHTKRNFVVPAIPAYSSNIIIAVTAIFLGARYGIVGLAWGTTVGFASQFFVQLPSVVKHGVFRGKFDLRHPGLRKMWRVLPPILLGSAAIEFKSMIDRLFGSLLPDGAISSLSYANRIYLMPNGILILALLTVMYPTLVELGTEGKMKDFKDTFRQGAGLIVVMMLPIMVGLVLLREPLVRLIFERNQFDPMATALTATALGYYGISLLPLGLMLLIKRTFFALKDTSTPMLLTGFMVMLNILFNWILMKPLGHGGIALGTSLSVYLGMLGLAFFLRRKIGRIGGYLLLSTLKKSFFATLVMGVLVTYGMRFLPAGGLAHGLALLVLIGAGAVVYLGISYKLRVVELDFALDMIRGRFGRKKR